MSSRPPRIADASIRAAFDAFPPRVRADLLSLRALIFETAAQTEGVGALAEMLKWGQPAYAPAGVAAAALRIGAPRGAVDRYALYVNCRSALAEEFRQRYPGVFSFEGDRALLFGAGAPCPRRALAHCIALAFTYRTRRRR